MKRNLENKIKREKEEKKKEKHEEGNIQEKIAISLVY